jgi:hypothetical protein
MWHSCLSAARVQQYFNGFLLILGFTKNKAPPITLIHLDFQSPTAEENARAGPENVGHSPTPHQRAFASVTQLAVLA